MTATAEHGVVSTEPNEEGYREFSLGEFRFRRDEYFVYITWPTGHHIMSVDAFLRALQRDIAWDFFYGTVNFDHSENIQTPRIRETFKSILDDWTNETFDPFASPHETGSAFGIKNGDNHGAVTRQRVQAGRMVGLPGDAPLRSDEAGYLVNRMFADVPQDEPEVYAEPGFEDQVSAFSLFAYLSRSDVTWNPSVASVCKESLFCPTTEEYILPIIHGNDRVEWFIQLTDQITWEVEDRETGAVRARVVMKAGDVSAMPADIRHQGYSPKRSMLLVWENASADLPDLIASGKTPTYPIDF